MSNGNKKHIFSAQMNMKRKLKEHKNFTASSKDQLKMCTTLNAHKQEEKVLHKCSSLQENHHFIFCTIYCKT